MEYKKIEQLITQMDVTMPPPEQEPERQYYFIRKLQLWMEQKRREKGRALTACVTTFGCQMNARDSEKILGILHMIGYEETESEEADLVLYNTCTVRENANLKVYGHLGQLKKYKQKNPEMLTLLCGCMMQEPEVVEKLKKSFRNVDIIFGTHNIFKFAELLAMKLFDQSGSRKMIIDIWKDTTEIVEELPNERKYSFKSGVNVMFGCNNFCSYCIVPYVRGRERSREPEDIIAEIEGMVKDGVVEIMLLGQNVNSYGKNLEHPISFAQLLQRVEQIEGLERIRFMTSHPKDLSDELIEVMKHSQKICKQMHLPLQSGSSRLLKIMNRHYDKESYLLLVKKIREAIPDIALTTDIIVGFPGETEDDFDDTMDVVEQVEYDSAFTFIYSKRTGTPAAAMEDQVPEDVVKERFDRLLKKIQDISARKAAADEGKTEKVLVEEVNRQDSSLVTGRTSKNYLVHFPGDVSLIGKIVSVKLCESKGFYYIGRMVE
ncbi:MAG: tRNA (N6-isopentenyl adenosine(37)-C2)-methylthiotransferase MiaB [Lachnospiraceae bacterium]|nr:tRNA (N6-isopentenyl adenosine(37)-C2)-methylthiotransferase MiaB [Lachnospiraceae bacterium]